jgi:hypothetical protein
MKNYLRQNVCWLLGWILLIGFAGLTGCKSTDSADSGELASVKISNRTDAEIERAAAKVFLADAYEQIDLKTFDKQGTSWDKMAYGGWSSNPVWIRMRINIVSAEPGQSILACDAYAVIDRDEPSMMEEKKLSVAYRSECKKILDQVKARLEAPPDKGVP